MKTKNPHGSHMALMNAYASAKNPHAQALGSLGGLARAAKMTPEQRAAAAAKAGKAGGWPKGRPRKPKA